MAAATPIVHATYGALAAAADTRILGIGCILKAFAHAGASVANDIIAACYNTPRTGVLVPGTHNRACQPQDCSDLTFPYLQT
jgi:hypothetical protein